jgi:TonB family protein
MPRRADAPRARAPLGTLRGLGVGSALLALLGCSAERRDQRVQAQAERGANDVPVAINGESPFQYPPELYDQGVEGEVRLRLYVDALGRVRPESTRVASSSGTPALDSAAVAGSVLLRFAPAHRGGQPVGMAFYQPVIFRRRAAPGALPSQ